MNQPTETQPVDELELTLETLDQWEDELDAFAADIIKRLSLLPLAPGPAAHTETPLPSAERPDATASETSPGMIPAPGIPVQ